VAGVADGIAIVGPAGVLLATLVDCGVTTVGAEGLVIVVMTGVLFPALFVAGVTIVVVGLPDGADAVSV